MHCAVCTEKDDVFYSTIYNDAFENLHLVSHRKRNEWVCEFLVESSKLCWPHQYRALHSLSRAISSQTLFHCIQDSLRDKLKRTLRQLELRKNMRTRRVQRQMIRFLYRPHGRIYKKDMACLGLVDDFVGGQ